MPILTARYRIRFSAHVSGEYQQNLFIELAELFGAIATQIAEGDFEIHGFRTSTESGVLTQLQAEESAGRLRLLDASR
jgi:hypothetical protein